MHWPMILVLTLILSMPASTRSWSTSFCAWTTLLLLPIFPDISLKLKKVLAISFHSKKSIRKKNAVWRLMQRFNLCCAGESGQRSSWLCPFTCVPLFFFFNSLMGSVQRLCDVKGHAAHCWKCHKCHTLLHSHEWWEDERHHKTFCSGVVVFSALWAQHINYVQLTWLDHSLRWKLWKSVIVSCICRLSEYFFSGH